MELYFASLKGSSEHNTDHNLVTFAIPDIGVRFKAPFPAKDMTLEYASLLTLLEFIEINPNLFSNRALELYSHNTELVRQINESSVPEIRLIPFLKKALAYRQKFNFTINVVNQPDNPATNPSSLSPLDG